MLAHIHPQYVMAIVQNLQVDNDKRNLRKCKFLCVVSLNMVKGKVKCTLVQAPRLCTGHMAHRGSRGVALLFLDHSTRRG